MLNSRTGTLRIFTQFVPKGPDQNKNEKHTKVNQEPERRKKLPFYIPTFPEKNDL